MNHPNYILHVEKIRRKRITLLNNIIKNNGGVWKNIKDYNGISSYCEIICNQNHLFKVINRRIESGTWCPYCSSNINVGEELCRTLLEKLLGFPLENTRRIEGLKNPETNYPLEIDGFNKVHKLGFEYQGIQHFQYTPYIHKNINNFKKALKMDKIKEEFFKKNNLILIKILQFKKFDINYMHNEIIILLKNHNIPYKKLSDQTLKNIMKNLYKKNILIKPIIIKKKRIKRPKPIKKEPLWTEAKALKILNRYKYVKNIKKNHLSLYNWLIYTKKYHKLTKDKIRILKPAEYSLKDLKKFALEYNTRREFRKKNYRAYNYATKTNQLDLVCQHMIYFNSGHKYKVQFSDDFLIQLAQKYKTLIEFKKAEYSKFKIIKRRNLQDKAFKHMK